MLQRPITHITTTKKFSLKKAIGVEKPYHKLSDIQKLTPDEIYSLNPKEVSKSIITRSPNLLIITDEQQRALQNLLIYKDKNDDAIEIPQAQIEKYKKYDYMLEKKSREKKQNDLEEDKEEVDRIIHNAFQTKKGGKTRRVSRKGKRSRKVKKGSRKVKKSSKKINKSMRNKNKK
jgi:hypothetical protein